MLIVKSHQRLSELLLYILALTRVICDELPLYKLHFAHSGLESATDAAATSDSSNTHLYCLFTSDAI
jgi:hypothetical protein